MRDAIVIGAGMAGVTAARELERAGLSVTVVEARERVGGRIWSLRDFCDEPVEAGAEFIHGSRARTWPEVRAAGFETRPCPLVARTLLEARGGARWLPWVLLHPATWPSFAILGQVRRARAPDCSARAFLDRRGYRGRARRLAELTLTAHLPGSADQIGVLGLVDDGGLHLATGRNYRVADGYDGLPRAIGWDLDVRHGFAAERVGFGPDFVTVHATDGRELAARAGVCTLPVGVLKSGAVRFEPGLPASKRDGLARIEMGPVAKVLLHFRERFWPRWATTIACARGPVTLYWPVFHGAGAGPAVLAAYLTGPRAAALSAAGEERALAVVLRDLARLFPGSLPEARLVSARRIDWAADPWSRGGYTFLRPGGVGARARLRAADTGALFWAGSATESAPVADTVEAAYASGLRAAAEAAAHLAAHRPRRAAGVATRSAAARSAAPSCRGSLRA